MAAKEPPKDLEEALHRDDPIAMSKFATAPELERIKVAEEVLELRAQRVKRNHRLAVLGQAMVGYIALAGFFANAYQNLNNKKQADARAAEERERWEKEFRRAQDADKYRAFFETSALATDTDNADKRLVGYALLKEFVDDSGYNQKATIMLEESLALELRGDMHGKGLDDEHRLAVVAILSALAHTSDCKALGQAARTVDRLGMMRPRPAKVHAGTAAVPPDVADDVEETGEVFELYARRLVGRATTVCGKAQDFRDVRRPIAEMLVRRPELGDLTGKITPAAANKRIAELIHEGCVEDRDAGLATDCPEIEKAYAKLCVEMAKLPNAGDDVAACAAMKPAAVASRPAAEGGAK